MARKSKYTVEEKEEVDRCNKIRSMLRRAWSRDPIRFATLRKARRDYKGENARQRFEYECAACYQYFKQSDVQVDHVIPTGSFLKLSLIGEWVTRLFCGDLQVLCSDCHKIKTNEERRVRNGKDI